MNREKSSRSWSLTFGIDKYRRPGIILADMIKRAARGDDKDKRHYYRAAVLAIDLDGGKLQNPNAEGGIDSIDSAGTKRHFKALHGVENPRGSIKARILSDGVDRLLDDADVRIFWPMFPQDQIGTPVSPGEHVYVIFEGVGMAHGLWLARVSGHDDANSYKGSDSYVAGSAQGSAMDSFEPNEPNYPQTDDHASMAPVKNANDYFDNGED